MTNTGFHAMKKSCKHKTTVLYLIKQKKEEKILKKFFGGIFIENEILRKEGIYHPVKLEYYKIENENSPKNGELKYGLEVVKTEYYTNDVKIEKNQLEGLTNDENAIKKILNILKENKVTPIGIQDVIKEIFAKRLQIAGN